MPIYEDYDLVITESKKGAYLARVEGAPCANANATFKLSELKTETLSCEDRLDAEIARTFGTNLFNAVFKDNLLLCFERCRAVAEARQRQLRINLNLSLVPELAALAWELLRDPRRDEFLARSLKTAIVRYLDQLRTVPKLAVSEPLRILVMVASPQDQKQLQGAAEKENLQQALMGLAEEGLVDIDIAESATVKELRDLLLRKSYQLFHFVGHGIFNSETGKGELAFEDEEHNSHYVCGAELGEIFSNSNARWGNEESLRLVFINVCEGARHSETDSYTGAAQELSRRGGIPAVIAMQCEISDQAALCFSEIFYRSLAAGMPVEAAVADARLAVAQSDNEVEWATPVLFLRAQNGELFNFEQVTPQARQRVRIKGLYQNALRAIASQQMETAERKLVEVISLDSTHIEARLKLREIQIANYYAEGIKLYKEDRLREALDKFRQVISLGGEYQDVSELIIEIKGKLPRPSLAETHYRNVIEEIRKGRMVFFLGSNANLCGRAESAGHQTGNYPPTAHELARYLALCADYPKKSLIELPRVSQYSYLTRGRLFVYEELDKIFAKAYEPTPLHEFLAKLPAMSARKGMPRQPNLIVTTNYDDLLEKAFDAAGEPYDLVYYNAEGRSEKKTLAGKFSHRPHGSQEAIVIDVPNKYIDLPITVDNILERTIILKVHGIIDRLNLRKNNYAVTEDHHVNYPNRVDFPAQLLAKFGYSYFLFLGASLYDWNMRALLQRIWGNEEREFKYWAVQSETDIEEAEIDRQFWGENKVDPLDIELQDYLAALRQRL